jgi:hypothetical protein
MLAPRAYDAGIAAMGSCMCTVAPGLSIEPLS